MIFPNADNCGGEIEEDDGKKQNNDFVDINKYIYKYINILIIYI